VSDITLTQLIAFNLTLLAAMASPGPAFLLVLRNSIADGRRAGILTGLALALSSAPARAAYLRGKLWANRIAAGVMATLGLRLLLER